MLDPARVLLLRDRVLVHPNVARSGNLGKRPASRLKLRLPSFYEIQDHLPDAEYWSLLANIWTSEEYPGLKQGYLVEALYFQSR